MAVRLFPGLVWLLWVGNPIAQAQTNDRFELGQRLRTFEDAWEKNKNAGARQRAIPSLLKATNFFFSFRLPEAGRSLDEARFALEAAAPPAPERLWAEAIVAWPGSRLIDLKAQEITVQVKQFYPLAGAVPGKAQVQFSLRAELAKAQPAVLGNFPVVKLPLEIKVPLKIMEAGDYQLRMEVMVDGKVLAYSGQTISFANDMSPRIKQLDEGAGKKMPAGPSSTDRESLKELINLLQRLARGGTLETNYPAHRLLREAEDLTRSILAGKKFYGSDQAGQFWLRLGGKSGSSIRIQVPPELAGDRPVPLVLALHGAGGSENLFFDGYGNGLAARLCARRGWLLVAPRGGVLSFSSPVAAIIDEIAQMYPVDRGQVFLLGHSMGAGQAVQASQQIPEKLAGVAALGGGGRLNKAEAVRKLPYFIGVGAKDFALFGAKALDKSLKTAKVESVEFREYADIEHLVIVQEALPDVFAMFDALSKKKRK